MFLSLYRFKREGFSTFRLNIYTDLELPQYSVCKKWLIEHSLLLIANKNVLKKDNLLNAYFLHT